MLSNFRLVNSQVNARKLLHIEAIAGLFTAALLLGTVNPGSVGCNTLVYVIHFLQRGNLSNENLCKANLLSVLLASQLYTLK